MGKSSSPDLKRLLPAVLLATFYVALAPLLVVWELRAAGVIHSSVMSVIAVLVLSLVVSSAGSAWWKKRQGSEDVLFGDLIAWSWIRRWRIERRLDEARTLLAGAEDTAAAPASQARLLQALASALEARDPYTHGHSRRVARFSVQIAKRMGLPAETVARVRTAAAVHDVGKISVPPAVLNKPGKLTDHEFALIKRHAQDSARMVRGLGDEQITAIVRHHHERLDGTGYPDALSGDEVPLGSRIIAVADTFDALTSRRPYRRPNSHKTAMDILAKEAGTQLDPDAVRAFRGCYSGKRSLTLWNGVTLVPERLLSALSAALNAGGAASTAQILTAAAATTLIGGTVVLSTTPATSAADRAFRKGATVAAVDASVPGVRSGSLVSIPSLAPGDGSEPRGTSASPRAVRPRAGSKRGSTAGPSTGPPSSSGSGTGFPSGSPPGGTGSGGSSDAGPLPQVPAGGGGVLPKLPGAGGPLPSAPSGGGLPDPSPGAGGLLPSLPSGSDLVPDTGKLTDPSGLPLRSPDTR